MARTQPAVSRDVTNRNTKGRKILSATKAHVDKKKAAGQYTKTLHNQWLRQL